ncbi:MAG: Uma2 family endonuclease [Planctomycetota bacterium]
MSTAEKRFISPQEYLTIERASEIRHEYYNGEMFAKSGGTRAHNLIAGNIFALFREQFADQDCEVYQADMRVKVDGKGLYTYPDVVTACDPKFEDEVFDTLINPRVIVEVLSKSTEDYDRGTKFEMYRRLPSLQDYVLVSAGVALTSGRSSCHCFGVIGEAVPERRNSPIALLPFQRMSLVACVPRLKPGAIRQSPFGTRTRRTCFEMAGTSFCAPAKNCLPCEAV